MHSRALAWLLTPPILASVLIPVLVVFGETPQRCEGVSLVVRCGPGDASLKLVYLLMPMRSALLLCEVGCVFSGLAILARPTESTRALLAASAQCTVLFAAAVLVGRWAVAQPFERTWMLTSVTSAAKLAACAALWIAAAHSARPRSTAHASRISALGAGAAAWFLWWSMGLEQSSGFAPSSNSIRTSARRRSRSRCCYCAPACCRLRRG